MKVPESRISINNVQYFVVAESYPDAAKLSVTDGSKDFDIWVYPVNLWRKRAYPKKLNKPQPQAKARI